MKKALQISLAHTLFTVEEDAYAKLESYLASVREHFKDTAGYTEIIADIEASIAEQLLAEKHKIVSIEQVEKILGAMGRVEDFDDGAEHTETPKAEHDTQGGIARKKLYRNTDNAMIAGVCSGIAAYMGWEVTWVRIAMLVLTLFNGIGIVLYIILWIATPEAKTASQKLEMMGSPVTIENLSETVRERIEEVKRDGRIERITALPARLLERIGPVLRLIVGLCITIVAGVALACALAASGFVLSDTVLVHDSVPLATILPGALYGLSVAGFLLVVIIPILALLFAGLSILQRRAVVPAALWAILIGMWFLAVGVSGYAVAKIIGSYEGTFSMSRGEWIQIAPSSTESQNATTTP